MQPWQQQSYGYNSFNGAQNPQQTGSGSFMQSQPTGFPGQGPQQPQQGQQRPGGNLSFLNAPPPSSQFNPSGMAPQMTGYPGAAGGGMMSQQTGYGGMMSQPTGMMGQQTGMPGMMGQRTGMMSQQTGMMPQQTGYGGGMMSQPTGFGGGLRAQPTGYQDPRLQSMMQSFMPSNMSQPFASTGAPQFNSTPQNQPLTHTFQTLLQNPSVKTPKVPWTLSKQEKKDYDQIFRAWEKGDGFVSGETAREVFGQSGLNQDDLIKIWTLSDVDNRGKLNLPEFHVAMGLVYRALNGNELPDKLPEEMVPPSMRDIDTTVNFMRDLLKHESTNRSNTSSPAYGGAPSANQSKDAVAYKHDDTRSGSTYKPSSRHLDRKSVRYAGEESGAEIGDLRRQLQNTSALLDKSNADYDRKTDEDEQLEQEVDDLKYRVKRLQEDIDYVSKGRRSAEKDEERRKLEREVLFLMHEKLPELERRQQQREEERKMEERAGVRARDRRNDTHGRYDDRDRDSRDDHAWLRGSYDRERRDSRDRSRDRDNYRRDDRDRDYQRRESRDRDRDHDYRPRSPPASRTPPPAPPPAPVAAAPPPAAPPKPTSAAAVPNTKNMTPEERTAFIREQAQRRIQDRLRALGVESAPAETPAVDKSVEERLAQEKKEAEERSKTADEEQKAREAARQARLAGGGAPKDETPKSPEPKSILKGSKAAPPPPASRAKQPPKPPAPRSAAPSAPPAPPDSTPAAPAQPEEDDEEAEFRRREETIKKAKEDRRRRLAELEREEEEERKREEEAVARKAKSSAAQDTPVAPTPPAAPPAPPAPGGGGYNPFRKPGAASTPSAAPASSPGGGFNPFFKPQGAQSPSPATTPAVSAPPAPAPPPAPPAPPAPAPPAQVRSPPPADDGWESIHEKEADSDDDSSDEDDYAKSRDNRRNLASALFGGLTGGSSNSPASSRPGSAAPKPSAALKNIGGGDPNAGRGALLSAIQGGARLKKAQTVVKGAAVSGKVIGEAAPPAHISETPRDYAPEQKDEEESFTSRNENRQSVDWYAGLAADQTHPAQAQMETLSLETTREEPEPASTEAQPEQQGGAEEDELADFDLTQSLRVRTLYPYEGQRDVDLTFKEDTVIVAHPAKDASSPWWYGLVVDGGARGWFPHDYVEEIKGMKARALYSYAGTTEEELPFAEGDELVIVDQSDADWWKAEQAGIIFIVPASYLEIIDRDGLTHSHVSPASAAAPSASRLDSGLKGDPLNLPREDEEYPQSTDVATQQNSLSAVAPSPIPSSFLSPAPSVHAGRPRSSTIASHTSHASSHADADQEDEGESSDDSVLSWWSSDEDDSDVEGDNGGENKVQSQKTDAERQKREEERLRREEERLKMLSSAGLQLRREAPAPPGAGESRRPAPGVPKARKQRRKAPAVPRPSLGTPDETNHTGEAETGEGGKPLDTLDAYARYEQFLAESKNKPSSPAPVAPSLPLSATSATPLPGHKASPSDSAVSIPLSPTASTGTSGRTGAGAGNDAGGGGRLSGFFSRMMQNTGSASAPGERRATISGPIAKVDESGVGTPDAAAAATSDMGKTWSSLVDPGILGSMSDRERKRQEAIYEFIQTESTYNRDLQLIVQVFYASLLDTLDEKAQTVIFANVEDILLANTAFLSDLEERQRETRLYVDRVGDVVREHMGNMDVYTTYCVNQSQAGQLLQSLRSNDSSLNSKLETISQTNPVVRGLDLSHFLLIPMQRITRYPLLLKQIIHYADTDQDLSLLEQGLRTVETIVGRINESVRENESVERLRVLSEDLWIGGEGRLDLTAPTAYQGPRKLIKEGIVLKAKSGRKLTLVLCNDILVLIDSRNLYRMPIPLFECTVRRGRDDMSFVLKVEYRRGGDTIGLKGTSAREAKEWRYLIEEARLKAVDARMVSGSGGMRGF